MTPIYSNTNTGSHLSDVQMSELLDSRLAGRSTSSSFEAAEDHLNACATCAEELAGLEQALSLYQEASIAHADREFTRLRALDSPAYPVLPANRLYSQTLWLVAASAVLIAGILPLEMRWQRTVSTSTLSTTASVPASTHTAESDEALLQDIDRELSASVPAPMQALSDPTGSAATQTSIDTDTQTSTQRKD